MCQHVLKDTTRFKDGKEHHYWSVVENRRVAGGRKVVQRHVLYLGEINASQQAAWQKTIEIFEADRHSLKPWRCSPRTGMPWPTCEDRAVMLSELELRRPRQWGACWLACGCSSSWGWTISGRAPAGPAARARGGIRCCRPWWRTG